LSPSEEFGAAKADKVNRHISAAAWEMVKSSTEGRAKRV
jgi:hypothetical protein